MAKESLERMIGIIRIPEYYKRIESEMKRVSQDEKIAEVLGFFNDNYYTATEKRLAENSLKINFGCFLGSFGVIPDRA